MEIKVNIPKNDYVQPTEVRQDIVQAICEVFLGGGAWSIFHPFKDGRRIEHNYVRAHKTGKFFGFASYQDYDFAKSHPYFKETQRYLKFNGAEMKAAFKVLIDSGYYMFRVYEYGTWMGYKCGCKPYMDGGVKVSGFDDLIE